MRLEPRARARAARAGSPRGSPQATRASSGCARRRRPGSPPSEALPLAGDELHERLVDDQQPPRPRRAARALASARACPSGCPGCRRRRASASVRHVARVEAPAPRLAEHLRHLGSPPRGSAASGSVKPGWTQAARRGPQRGGEQPERLAGAVQQQHLLGSTAVARRDGRSRGARRRDTARLVERRRAAPAARRGGPRRRARR